MLRIYFIVDKFILMAIHRHLKNYQVCDSFDIWPCLLDTSYMLLSKTKIHHCVKVTKY